MLPATLAILSGTFQGRERATAFAAWGATAGVAAAVGPLVGGFLTTNFSWRWAFGINVIVAPLTIIGALLFMKPNAQSDGGCGSTCPARPLIAAGMFLLVFALSEGGALRLVGADQGLPRRSVHTMWPATSADLDHPGHVRCAALVILAAFYAARAVEGARATATRCSSSATSATRTYRYGLLTGMIVAMGQLGLSFVLAVFLQDGKHLTAEQNGLWLLPTGVFVIIGAQLGGRLIRAFGTTMVVRLGLVLDAVGDRC